MVTQFHFGKMKGMHQLRATVRVAMACIWSVTFTAWTYLLAVPITSSDQRPCHWGNMALCLCLLDSDGASLILGQISSSTAAFRKSFPAIRLTLQVGKACVTSFEAERSRTEPWMERYAGLRSCGQFKSEVAAVDWLKLRSYHICNYCRCGSDVQ